MIGAPQDDANTREHLAKAERLGQVVIGAQFQSQHPVGLVAAMTGHDDDRQIEVAAHLAQQIQPVFAPEIEIEQDECMVAFLELMAHSVSGVRNRYVDAVIPKI